MCMSLPLALMGAVCLHPEETAAPQFPEGTDVYDSYWGEDLYNHHLHWKVKAQPLRLAAPWVEVEQGRAGGKQLFQVEGQTIIQRRGCSCGWPAAWCKGWRTWCQGSLKASALSQQWGWSGWRVPWPWETAWLRRDGEQTLSSSQLLCQTLWTCKLWWQSKSDSLIRAIRGDAVQPISSKKIYLPGPQMLPVCLAINILLAGIATYLFRPYPPVSKPDTTEQHED